MNRGPKTVTLIDAQSADETTSQAIDLTGYSNAAFYLQGSGTISSGVVTYETAVHDPSHSGQIYGGTWSEIATVNAADVTAGAQKRTALTPGEWGLVRARISTVLAGTVPLVTVVLKASE